jgi:hypothetical protein
MKKLNYIFMIVAFITTGISAVLNYANGLSGIWQIICMVWIANSFILSRTADKNL